MERYRVKLEGFEGPLDLLLHLVQQAEVDLYDIPVAEITAQYMSYIHAMQELELDMASEYLVMASTLLAIKSKMLLPKQEMIDEEYDEEWFEEDPRDALAAQLELYRKYKEAAVELKEKSTYRALSYSKSPTDLEAFQETNERSRQDEPIEASLTDLIQAFQRMKQRIRFEKPHQTTVENEEWTIEDKMNSISSAVIESKIPISFQDTFAKGVIKEQVTTFIALLQLVKDGSVSCEQDHNFADIFIEARKAE